MIEALDTKHFSNDTGSSGTAARGTPAAGLLLRTPAPRSRTARRWSPADGELGKQR